MLKQLHTELAPSTTIRSQLSQRTRGGVGRWRRRGRVVALRQARALRQAAQQPVLAHAVLQRAHGRRIRARVRAAHHKVRDVPVRCILRGPGSLIVLYTICGAAT